MTEQKKLESGTNCKNFISRMDTLTCLLVTEERLWLESHKESAKRQEKKRRSTANLVFCSYIQVC